MTDNWIILIVVAVWVLLIGLLLYLAGADLLSIRLTGRSRTNKRSDEAKDGRKTETITEVFEDSEGEILAEMCQLPLVMTEMFRAGERLSDEERRIIFNKQIGVFGALRPVDLADCARIERMLRRLLQDSDDRSYGTARAKARRRKQMFGKAARQTMEIDPDKAAERLEIWSKTWKDYLDGDERGAWRDYLD